MADNNNTRAHNLPKAPHPALKSLDRLIGTWTIKGRHVEGRATFEWMEGGFFFVHRFDMNHNGLTYKGIEYTGFDEETQSLRSRMVDTRGANFTYTWELDGDTLWYWFGDKGSPHYSRGVFSKDGNTINGKWHWPEDGGRLGGYEYITRRIR